MTRGLTLTALLGALVALGALACGDKSNAGALDGGDSALVARSRDAGGEGGASDGGSSSDDLVMPQPAN